MADIGNIQCEESEDYVEKLKRDKLFWLLEDNVLVFRDMDKIGRPARKSIVLTPRTFTALTDPTRYEQDFKLYLLLYQDANGGKTKKDTNVRMFVCTQNLNEWS